MADNGLVLGGDLRGDVLEEAPSTITGLDPTQPVGYSHRDTVRRLRELVRAQDPQYHGLERVSDCERVMWVHPRFQRNYGRRRPPRHPSRIDTG